MDDNQKKMSKMSKDIQAFICIFMMCGWMPKGDFGLRRTIAESLKHPHQTLRGIPAPVAGIPLQGKSRKGRLNYAEIYSKTIFLTPAHHVIGFIGRISDR
jgi:hypothetical protein